MRIDYGFLAIVALASCGSAALAQNPATSPADPNDRLDQVERRLIEIERQHQADLKERDQEIARLRQQLQAGRGPATTATGTAAPSADDIERARQDVLRDIEQREAGPLTLRRPASFNPDIAVIGDFRGNVSSRSENPARNRWDIGAVELDLRAAVDPRADAVAIIHFGREVEDPLFPEHHHDGEEEHDDGSVHNHVEVEEAYLFLHDFGLSNTTATLGRFRLPFGRWNILHMHDWPTVDNALVMQSFFGPEGIGDAGLSLSYVMPPRLTGGHYIELIGAVVTGEGGEHSPVFNNSALGDVPAFATQIKWNRDIARDWNLELGTSWIGATREDDNDVRADVFGTHAVLVRTDPSGGFDNQLLQAEVLYGRVDTDEGRRYPLGAYVLFQQQLNRDWYAGARLDWTENPLNDREEAWAVSPYVSWYWSEFLRFRLQYQHKGGDVPSEDSLWFQATFVFGAHPPHPYWAMR